MFNFQKQSKQIKKESQEQYQEMLKENGYSVDDNKEGFILGEKKRYIRKECFVR